jgi:hypothetical protein
MDPLNVQMNQFGARARPRPSSSQPLTVTSVKELLANQDRTLRTRWKGSIRDAFVAMLFLHGQHPDECITLSQALGKIHVGHDITKSLSWYDVSLVWVGNRLHFPARNRDLFIEKANKCSARFLLTMLVIVSPDRKHMHANFIIWDNTQERVERYESYGITPHEYGTRDGRLDLALKQAARDIWSPNSGIVFPMLPKMTGIQDIQEGEIGVQSTEDPIGFCVAHSTLYAHVRIMNRMLPATAIPGLILKLMNEYEADMTMFIRLFSNRVRKEDDNLRSLGVESIPEGYVDALLGGARGGVEGKASLQILENGLIV